MLCCAIRKTREIVWGVGSLPGETATVFMLHDICPKALALTSSAKGQLDHTDSHLLQIVLGFLWPDWWEFTLFLSAALWLVQIMCNEPMGLVDVVQPIGKKAFNSNFFIFFYHSWQILKMNYCLLCGNCCLASIDMNWYELFECYICLWFLNRVILMYHNQCTWLK